MTAKEYWNEIRSYAKSGSLRIRKLRRRINVSYRWWKRSNENNRRSRRGLNPRPTHIINKADLYTVIALVLLLVAFLLPFLILPWYMAVFADSVVLMSLMLSAIKVYQMAKTRGWPLFFPEQGKAYLVNRKGEFEKIIMAYDGYHLNNPKDPDSYDYAHANEGSDWYEWYVLPNKWKRTLPNDKEVYTVWKDPRPYILRRLGAHWLSIWPNVRVSDYELIWKEWRAKKDGTLEVWAREEPTDHVFVKTAPYAVEIKEAEVVGRVRVDILGTVQIRACNPKTAIAKNDQWFMQTEGYILDQLRQFANTSDLDEMLAAAVKPAQPSPKSSADPISDLILRLNDNIPGLKHHALSEGPPGQEIGLRRLLGQEIVSFKIDQVRISHEESKRIYDAIIAQKAEEEEGKASITKAEFAAKVKVKEGVAAGEAEAARVGLAFAAVQKFGDLGRTLRQLEAMQQSAQGAGSTIIWANNPLVGGTTNNLAEELQKSGITATDLVALIQELKKGKPTI